MDDERVESPIKQTKVAPLLKIHKLEDIDDDSESEEEESEEEVDIDKEDDIDEEELALLLEEAVHVMSQDIQEGKHRGDMDRRGWGENLETRMWIHHLDQCDYDYDSDSDPEWVPPVHIRQTSSDEPELHASGVSKNEQVVLKASLQLISMESRGETTPMAVSKFPQKPEERIKTDMSWKTVEKSGTKSGKKRSPGVQASRMHRLLAFQGNLEARYGLPKSRLQEALEGTPATPKPSCSPKPGLCRKNLAKMFQPQEADARPQTLTSSRVCQEAIEVRDSSSSHQHAASSSLKYSSLLSSDVGEKNQEGDSSRGEAVHVPDPAIAEAWWMGYRAGGGPYRRAYCWGCNSMGYIAVI